MRLKFELYLDSWCKKERGICSRFTDGKGNVTETWWSSPPDSIDHVDLGYIQGRHGNAKTKRHEIFIKDQFKEQFKIFEEFQSNRYVKVEYAESYTTEQAAQKALEYCESNKGWKRICDIENSDALYKTWDELPKKLRKAWINEYGEYSAQNAWEEFGESYCKVPMGFISGKGKFFKNVLDVPIFHNMMTIYKVS